MALKVKILNDLKYISFDQYQRYSWALKLIKLKSSDKKLDILEIGAFNCRYLHELLPEHEVKYLDVEIPEEYQNNPDYMKADASRSGLLDKSYDIIIALDVYEHIHKNDRELFVSELLRIARKLVVFCAPFNSDKVSESENRLNSWYKILFKQDHRWLKEHIDIGLPELNEVIQILEKKCPDYLMFGHGNLGIWEDMLRMTFMAEKDNFISEYLDNLNYFYNTTIFEGDVQNPVYRHFFICPIDIENNCSVNLKNEIKDLNFNIANEQNIKWFNQIKDSYYRLFNQINNVEKCREFTQYLDQNIEKSKTGLHETIDQKFRVMTQYFDQNAQRIREVQEQIEHKNKVIFELQEEVIHKTYEIKKLEKMYNDMCAHASRLTIRSRIKRKLGVLKKIKNKITNFYTTETTSVNDVKNKSYEEWIKLYEFGNEFENHDVSLSIIIKSWNRSSFAIETQIESIINQKFSNWHLYILGAENKIEISSWENIDELKGKFTWVKSNEDDYMNDIKEILLNSDCDYFCFLNDKIILSSIAFENAITEIYKNKDFLWVYGDTDFKDENGTRHSPKFKSSWSLDLFSQSDEISDFSLFNTKYAINSWKENEYYELFESLVLDIITKNPSKLIGHIPKILSHHLKIKNSDLSEYFFHEQKKQNLFSLFYKKFDTSAKVEISNDKKLRVVYELNSEPSITVIIPTKDRLDLLARCVETLLSKTNYKKFDVIIVNNNSVKTETKEYFDKIKSDKIVVIDFNEEFNFSKINNFAAQKSNADYLIFLNNDTEIIDSDWMREMISQNKRAGVAIVGAKLYYPNLKVQHAGVLLGLGGIAGHYQANIEKNDLGYFGRAVLTQELSAVTAACMSIDRNIFNEVKGFDEELSIAFNDVDLCLKVRDIGYKIIWTPYAELLHHESISRGQEDNKEKLSRFRSEIEYIEKKWGFELLNSDPFYNPNLSLSLQTDFKISSPPREHKTRIRKAID